MADEKHNLASPFSKRVQIEVPKLGWLSSYTRQILLSRHALRTFFIMMDYVARETAKPSRFDAIGAGQDTLTHLRALIEILSGSNKRTLRLSAPYAPLDRPQKFFLGEARKGHLFSVVIKQTEAFESKGTTFAVNGLATKNSFTWIGQDNEGMSIDILAQEIEIVRKGVSLSNKSVADERCDELISKPLWPEGTGRVWQSAELFQPLSSTFADSFTFWRDWYQGFLDGKPLDWELQRRVALVPDEDWEKGPEHIAEKIEGIKAAWLAEKAPLAENIEFNAETQKFHTVPLDIAKPDLLGATLSQIEDALEDVLANPSNGLHERSREVRVLNRVFTKYGNNPQQIEMGLVSAHKGITRQFLSDEMPQSEENLALRDALEEGARGIRATHPDVAENRKILNDQAMREMSQEDLELLEDAKPLLVAMSEGQLADDWETDIPQLINDATLPVPSGAPPLPGADEATRIFSRAAKMKLSYDGLVSKGAEAFDSKTVKTVRLGLTLGGLLSALVGMGLRLFGLI